MRFRAVLIGLVLAAPVNFAAPNAVRFVAPGSFFGGPILIDPDVDLPVNPTIEQLVGAGKKHIADLRKDDQTLDSNRDLSEYLSSLGARLIAAQDIKPPYPIEIHCSTMPELNAYAAAGGQMMVYSDMILFADNEAQLVGILAHELSHEIHNDYAFFWHAAKVGEDSYGRGGLLEKSRAIEQRADAEAARMMYKAGWDPKQELVMMRRLAKRWRLMREGHRVFYSTHPEDRDRLKPLESVIDSLAPKDGLTKDSARFQQIKQTL